MKKNMSMMTGASFGIAFDPASGGGIAAPPAPPAPAPAPAAPPAPAAAAPAPTPAAPPPTKTGFFAGLKRQAAAPPPEAPKPGAVPDPTAQVQVLADDKKTVLFEGSRADAEAFVKNGGKAAPATPPVETPKTPPAAPPAAAGSLARPFMGRADITTQEAAEDLYRKSGTEALRLHEKAKTLEATLQQKAVDAEARMAALTAELDLARKTPAVVEKTDVELEALAKENPYQFHRYMEAKTAREKAAQNARETAETAVREKHRIAQEGTKKAMANWTAMKGDPKTHPKFSELEPSMDTIYDGLPEDIRARLDYEPLGPQMLHDMALGRVYKELLVKGVEVKADAAEAARLKAETDAAALRGPSGAPVPAAPDTRTAEQKNDDEWRARRAAARGDNPGSRVFRTRTSTTT